MLVFRFSSIPIAKVLKKESDESWKGNIGRTGLTTDSVHQMIEYETGKVKHSIRDQGVENSELKRVELVKASCLVAKAFADDARDQFQPAGRH